jgi:glutamine synthetase
LVLAAGLDGIRRNLKPGDPVNTDTYKTSEEDLKAAGIHRLPATLGEAVDEFEASDFARDVLGADVHASFVALKRAEWLEYNTIVSDWERKQYLQLW